MTLQAIAIAGHAGAAHDQHIGTVVIAKLGGDLGHAAEGAGFVDKLDDAQADGAVAGHPVVQPHLSDIAQMARDRSPQDGDHAEALAERKRGQDAALGDAQDGLRCYLSRGMQLAKGKTS